MLAWLASFGIPAGRSGILRAPFASPRLYRRLQDFHSHFGIFKNGWFTTGHQQPSKSKSRRKPQVKFEVTFVRKRRGVPSRKYSPDGMEISPRVFENGVCRRSVPPPGKQRRRPSSGAGPCAPAVEAKATEEPNRARQGRPRPSCDSKSHYYFLPAESNVPRHTPPPRKAARTTGRLIKCEEVKAAPALGDRRARGNAP